MWQFFFEVKCNEDSTLLHTLKPVKYRFLKNH